MDILQLQHDLTAITTQVAGFERLGMAYLAGSHLYGFASPYFSDYDVRGIHVEPLASALGLDPLRETLSVTHSFPESRVELKSYDIRHLARLICQGHNANLYEMVVGGIVLRTAPWEDELVELTKQTLTSKMVLSHEGHANKLWRRFLEEVPQNVKPLLHAYRLLYSGILLLSTGAVELSLPTLCQLFKDGEVADLVTQRVSGDPVAPLDVLYHRMRLDQLQLRLAQAYAATTLPSEVTPEVGAAWQALVARIRLEGGL